MKYGTRRANAVEMSLSGSPHTAPPLRVAHYTRQIGHQLGPVVHWRDLVTRWSDVQARYAGQHQISVLMVCQHNHRRGAVHGIQQAQQAGVAAIHHPQYILGAW